MKLIREESAGLRILEQIQNLRVVHLEQGCCGMGGTFGMKRGFYDLSREIGAPLFSAIQEEGPDLIATECSACQIQLQNATGIPAIHPLEILADTIPD
jgi:glycerol-3-phosphate dehydrogenase subunit C